MRYGPIDLAQPIGEPKKKNEEKKGREGDDCNDALAFGNGGETRRRSEAGDWRICGIVPGFRTEPQKWSSSACSEIGGGSDEASKKKKTVTEV